MNIAMSGGGNVGSALAARLVAVGHRVSLAARQPDSPRLSRLALKTGASTATPVAAVADTEMVVLAVPYAAVDELIASEVRDVLVSRVVVDATNPLASDFMSFTVGHTTSAGKQNAARLPGSHVVKALNTVMAATLATPKLGGSASCFRSPETTRTPRPSFGRSAHSWASTPSTTVRCPTLATWSRSSSCSSTGLGPGARSWHRPAPGEGVTAMLRRR